MYTCNLETDIALLSEDISTYEMMVESMKSEHEIFYSDHETFIICMKDDNHACWVWTTDLFTVDTIEYVYRFLTERDLLIGGNIFNMKLQFAESFLKRAWEDTVDATIFTILSDIRNPDRKIARVGLRVRS